MEKISCGGFYIGDNLEIVKDEFGRPILNATGGGSGGEGITVVHMTVTGVDSYDITADVSAERALEILKAGGIVSLVVETYAPDNPEFTLTMALGPAVFRLDAPESPYMWIYYDGTMGFIPIVVIENGEWAVAT